MDFPIPINGKGGQMPSLYRCRCVMKNRRWREADGWVIGGETGLAGCGERESVFDAEDAGESSSTARERVSSVRQVHLGVEWSRVQHPLQQQQRDDPSGYYYSGTPATLHPRG